MSSYVLDKAYQAGSKDLLAYRAVCFIGQEHYVGLPQTDDRNALAGVTVHSQSLIGAHIAVRKLGIARCVAGKNGVMQGSPVYALSDGRVTTLPPPKPAQILGYAETSGTDGDVVEVFLAIQEVWW